MKNPILSAKPHPARISRGGQWKSYHKSARVFHHITRYNAPLKGYWLSLRLVRTLEKL